MITIQDIKEIITQTVTDIDITTIADDSDLRQIGVDSLDFFAIVLELQERSGIEVPDEDVEQLQTIEDLFNYFEARK